MNIIFVTILCVVVLFLVVATKRRWISWRGGGSFSAYTIMHDLVDADKQKAMEVVIEVKAEKKYWEQESGQDDEPNEKTQKSAG
jgi:hypothetical protein